MSYTSQGLGVFCPAPMVWSPIYSRCMNAYDPRLQDGGGMPVAPPAAEPAKGSTPIVEVTAPAAQVQAPPPTQPATTAAQPQSSESMPAAQPQAATTSSPYAPLATPGEVLQRAADQNVQYAQQTLSAEARQYLESRGVSAHCKIDDNWFSGPQGGAPSMLCSLNGGPYEHGAYALNLNPSVALVSMGLPVAAVSPPPGSAPPPATQTAAPPPLTTPPAAQTPPSYTYTPPAAPPPVTPPPAAPPPTSEPSSAGPYLTLPALPPLGQTGDIVGGVPNYVVYAVAAAAAWWIVKG